MSRFTLEITLRDRDGEQQPLALAVDLDHEVRISVREVGLMKAGFGYDFNSAVLLMKTREFRKKLFIEQATRLGALLAERMEDAEGWHDTSRIQPAREQLGGRWDK